MKPMYVLYVMPGYKKYTHIYKYIILLLLDKMFIKQVRNRYKLL